MDTLIMSCCGSKLDAGPVLALDLYQSRAYDLVREHAGERFQVLILSAHLGLVPADRLVMPYEQKMTARRARDITRDSEHYTPLDLRRAPGLVYVFGGELYRSVIRTWCRRESRPHVEIVGRGRGCGDHYSALKQLLVRGGAA